MSYYLIDSGWGRKLESFGGVVLVRPCPVALWEPSLPDKEWEKASGVLLREPENRWVWREKLPSSWIAESEGLKLKLQATDFGHVGFFPEHSVFWRELVTSIESSFQKDRERPKVLNLFAYSGGATLAAASAGGSVCHVDASRGMVSWARENAKLNGLEEAPIRWIVDDVTKFLSREVKRGHRYEVLICDPPSFGRGRQGEVFKIERDLLPLLRLCRQVLSEQPSFVLLSSHTPGFSPLVMSHLLEEIVDAREGCAVSGEMVLPHREGAKAVPSGSFAKWKRR